MRERQLGQSVQWVASAGQKPNRFVKVGTHRALKQIRQALTARLCRESQEVGPITAASNLCRDPLDIPILGTAVAGNAELLVTVDKDLLALRQFRGFVIIKPGEFWQRAMN